MEAKAFSCSTIVGMLGLRLLETLLHGSDALAIHLGRNPRRAAHLELGQRGEEAAYFYLRRLGFTLVAMDWRSGKTRGDLDLVGWEEDTLCFVEVKTRSSRNVATAEAAVDEDKIRVLRRLARQYLREMPSAPPQTRFDIVSVYYEEKPAPSIALLRNAFAWHEVNRSRPC